MSVFVILIVFAVEEAKNVFVPVPKVDVVVVVERLMVWEWMVVHQYHHHRQMDWHYLIPSC